MQMIFEGLATGERIEVIPTTLSETTPSMMSLAD